MKTYEYLKSIRNFVSTAKTMTAVIIMLATLLSSQIVHAAEPQLVVSCPSGTVNAGDTFDVTVSIIDNPGIAAFTLEIPYDNNKFEYVSVMRGQALIDAGLTPVSVAGAPEGYHRVSTLALRTDDFYGSGTLYSVRFRVRPNVSGIFAFTVEYKNNGIVNSYRQSVSLLTKEAQLLVGNVQTGVKITGLVKTFNPQNPTTLKLSGNNLTYVTTIGGIAGSGQVQQSFAFTNILPGIYTLELSKSAHLKYTVHNIVAMDEVNLASDIREGARDIALRCGDINGDGEINQADLNILWQPVNYNKRVSMGDNPLCDLNGDGDVNQIDLNILWQPLNYNRSAVVIP